MQRNAPARNSACNINHNLFSPRPLIDVLTRHLPRCSALRPAPTAISFLMEANDGLCGGMSAASSLGCHDVIGALPNKTMYGAIDIFAAASAAVLAGRAL